MLKLNNMKAPAGSNHAPKRKGLGIGSGLGKTAGKGHKGQKARSGGKHIRGYEGGQVPIQRRVPKLGFRSPLKPLLVKINITELGAFKGKAVSVAELAPKSKAKYSRLFLSIEGIHAPKTWPKSVEAHRVAPKTRELLEAAGVAVKVLEHKDGTYSTRDKAKA